jgi:hypothetical protein
VRKIENEHDPSQVESPTGDEGIVRLPFRDDNSPSSCSEKFRRCGSDALGHRSQWSVTRAKPHICQANVGHPTVPSPATKYITLFVLAAS